MTTRLHCGPRESEWGQTWNQPEYELWTVQVWEAATWSRVSSSFSVELSGYLGNVAITTAEAVLPAWAGELEPDVGSGQNERVARVVDARGWPWRALKSRFNLAGQYRDGQSSETITGVSGGILITPQSAEKNLIHTTLVFPLIPIWSGLFLDSVFYAVCILAIFFGLTGPGIVAGTIRRKRGQCIKCGYDLRGNLSHGCPECGWQREDVP
ncbi:MAG: hypothetical protein V3T84_02300 [Phycisphaerales bacterium]